MTLRKTLQAFIERETSRADQASLGYLNEATGKYVTDAPGNDGYVFITYGGENGFGGVVGIARNFQGAAPKVPVFVRGQGGVARVVKNNDSKTAAYNPNNNNFAYAVQKHTHGVGSGNVDPVQANRFIPGLVRPFKEGGSFGLKVFIESFIYEFDNEIQTWSGQPFDLTSSVPATPNKKVWAIVGVDPMDNTPTVVTGDEFSSVALMGIDKIDGTLFAGLIPLGAVVLTNGQTKLNNMAGFSDLRIFTSRVRSIAREEKWPFTTPIGATGIFYTGGFYDFFDGDNDFSPSVNFGTANRATGAHGILVLGAQTVDELTIRWAGTSITDEETRTAADTEDIVIPNGTVIDTFYETAKKWIGLVTISVVSGTAKTCNYGWTKYWDNNNEDFTVVGLEALWRAGANDANADIKLLHHRSDGWTFNAASTPTPPPAIATMQGTYVTEINLVNGDPGAWKISNLNTAISGSGSEGVLFEIDTSANRAFDLGSAMVRIETP